MFSTRIRFSLILFLTFFGTYLTITAGFRDSWFLLVAALLLLWSHFKFGTVGAAFRALQNGKLDETEQLLDQIKRPEWLFKTTRGYYHFAKGMVALQREESVEGEKHMKQALKFGLRTKKDEALVALNLAHLYFSQKNYEASRELLSVAQQDPSNDLMIKQRAEELDKALLSFNA